MNAGIAIFAERIVAKIFMKRKPDEAKVKQAIEEGLPPLQDYLEQQIGDAEFLVDGRFSIADIAVASPFVNFAHGGYSLDRKRWPKLSAYLERIHARPSFKASIEEERKGLGQG